MAPRATPGGRRARAGRGGGGGNALDRAVTLLSGLLSALNDPANRTVQSLVAVLLLAAEAALCVLIIRRVPYTEIDWDAYMEEVGGYLQGERDYAQLKGGTGPLVYPAGFVYLFAWLKTLTGGSVAVAQYIFAGVYLATQAAVMLLCTHARSLPPWALALLCASRRLHSIHVLRLFNDCWAMLGAYLATLALQRRRWVLSVLLFSAAVSVKMNVLLMAPGVLAVLIKHARPAHVAAGVAAGVALQLGLGAPFLAAYPASYLTRAFEFSRVFTFKWSVNWAFLPEPLFLSRQLALGLLFLHLRLLWALARKHWFASEGGLLPALRAFLARPAAPAAKRGGGAAKAGRGGGGGSFEDEVLFLVFSSNIVGIVAARSIHYQFYSWYWHTLPFLLLRGALPAPVGVAVIAGIELVYNVYPPRPWAAGLLLALHAVVVSATLSYRGTAARLKAAGPKKGPSAAGGAGAEAAAAGDDGPAAAAARRRRQSTAG